MDSIRKSNPQLQRLVLAAALFVAWIGMLAILAATTSRPVVLSRPQFMVSEFDVIAQIDQGAHGSGREVTIEEVHWPEKEKERLTGKKISVLNVDQCEGWQGPGRYILPLKKAGEESFVVALPGPSPGFDPMKPKARIYRETPETLRQLNTIEKSK